MSLTLSVVCGVLMLSAGVSSQEAPLSPCPRVFAYQNDGVSWYGVITVGPPYTPNLSLNLRMDVPELLPSGYLGRIEMLGERSEIVLSLTNGRPIRYRVNFPTLDYIPSITSIIFNGNLVCSGPKLNNGVRTSVELKHDLKTNLNEINGGFPTGSQDFYTQPSNTISNGGNQNFYPIGVNQNNYPPSNGVNRDNPFLNPEIVQSFPINIDNSNTDSINPGNPWLNNPTRPTQGGTWTQINPGTSNINPSNPWLQDNNRPGQQYFTSEPNTSIQPPNQPNPQVQPTPPRQPTRPISTTPPRTTPTRVQTPSNQFERPNPDTFAMVSNRRTTTPPPSDSSPENDRMETRNVCGMSKKLNNALVVRGETTNKGEWPWLVAVFVKRVSSLNFICGGTLISKELVVTAAHCFGQNNNRQVRKEEVIVRLGVHNIQNWVDDSKPYSVQELIFPPSFDGGLVLRNDIALLRVNRITYSDYVIPACLWGSTVDVNNYYGTFGTIIGWGRNEDGLVASPEPRLTRQRIVTTDECRDSNPAFSTLTSSTTLCAGNRNGSGPCNGDSGGGMFININGRWVLRGIVSNSLPQPDAPNVCNLANFVVYTDVSKFIDWITYYM